MQLSLRGSLAQEFVSLARRQTAEIAEKYVDTLIESQDPDLDKRFEGGVLIIGRVKERGRYPPDW